MADEAAEAAFINAMQNNNDTAGMMQGVSGAASQQQTDPASDDEYEPEPALAVQPDTLATDAQDLSVLSPSTAVKHDELPPTSLPQNTATTYATTAPQDATDLDAQNQSRSMSRDSSQSIKIETPILSGPGVENWPDVSVTAANNTVGDAKMAIVANGDSLDHASHNAPIVQTDSVSAPNVSLLNGVQHRPSPEVTQNGVASPNATAPAFMSDPAAVAPNNSLAVSETTQSKSQADVPTPTQPAISPTAALPKARLPHDRIGILEDRIKEDPRGDLDAWLSLISEHRKRGKLEDARNAYERLFTVFPWAADQWVAYAQMENEAQERARMEGIFSRALNMMPSLQLWTMYVEHIRRTQNITTDRTGNARQITHQAFRFALDRIGMDKDAGRLWQDYIQFVKSWPGVLGDNSWQAQQKMDELRKIYREAIAIPTQSLNVLWKEYDQFETGLNKMTGRKFLQEQSPSYMTARSSYTALQNITRNLRRNTMPVLPPALGFDGHDDYVAQLEIWKNWIAWEKDDPLVLKDEDRKAHQERIVYVYKQALMALRFWPEMWFDAAEFCFSEGLDEEGSDFLVQGIAANPEGCLLAFKQADRIELKTATEEGDEAVIRRGAAARAPFNKLLDALYELISKAKTRETQESARIEADFALQKEQQSIIRAEEEDDENNDNDAQLAELEKRKAANVEAVQSSSAAHVMLLRSTLTHAWIALMRSMRRIQGKGKVGDPIGGSRQIFTDARKRGRVTSDVYVESAMIEFHCYEAEAARKIFDRGLKLFPDDELFALAYIRHLIDINDHTNARVVFETAVSKLAQKPETLGKAKPLYAFFLDFESRYGELTQIVKLEARMRDLFPEDPTLSSFSRRFISKGFDATAIRPIISPATQTRSKPLPVPNIEAPTQHQDTPPKAFAPIGNSPKRPLPLDDSDTDGGRPRKIVRGESPLKGAAGRRLDQQKRNRQNDTPQYDGPSIPPPSPPSLPRDVLFFLSILPKAITYHGPRYEPAAMVKLLHESYIPDHVSKLPPRPGTQGPPQHMQSLHHPPPPPRHMAHVQQMQNTQYMPPMPSMPPGTPQYGQYNSGFSAFHSPSSQAVPHQRGGGSSEPRNGYGQGGVVSSSHESRGLPQYGLSRPTIPPLPALYNPFAGPVR